MRAQHWLLGVIFISAAPFALTACETNSISSNKNVGSGGSGGSGSVMVSSGSGGSGSATVSSSSGGGVPCAPEAAHIYAISTDKQLYRLDHVSAQPWATTLVGALACPTSADPYSIAIDRSAQAWVAYTDGSLFKVDTATAACVAAAFVPGQHGFTSFSMAFAADAPGSDVETLYVSGSGANGGSVGLARLDRSTLTLTPVGAYDNPQVTAQVQLTGTSDAKLFGGFLLDGRYYFATLDATSAHVIDFSNGPSLLIEGLPSATHHAVIPWGQYFYIFIARDGGMKQYFYETAGQAISSLDGPDGMTPVDLLTLSASTCATANQVP